MSVEKNVIEKALMMIRAPRPIIIHVGCEEIRAEILDFTTKRRGRTILVDPSKMRLDSAKRICKNKWPSGQWCLALGEGDDFYKLWGEPTQLIFINDLKEHKKLMVLARSVPFVIVSKFSPVNSDLERYGWSAMLEDDYIVWYRQPDQPDIIEA